LDEFEREIGGAVLRQDMAAVMSNCEEYARRFPSPRRRRRLSETSTAIGPFDWRQRRLDFSTA
jgi:hypothetical protein